MYWRADQNQKYRTLHKLLHFNVIVMIYIQEERGLFNFHLSNLEFACGAKLDNVS